MADAAGTWYVVKYMPDLRKREPRNVGVVLRSHEGWETRFFAQRDDGTVDGRNLRPLALRKPTYESWVEYFGRRFAVDDGPERILVEQAKRRGNFFVELGGHVLDDVDSWSVELTRLYASLVDDPSLADEDTAFDLRGTIDSIFRAANISPARSVVLEAAYRNATTPSAIRFDYEYVNGQRHLMDAVSLASPTALALAQSFESRAAAVREAGIADHFVAFVSTAHANHEVDELLSPLYAVAEVVNVDDRDEAVDHLRGVVSAPPAGGRSTGSDALKGGGKAGQLNLAGDIVETYFEDGRWKKRGVRGPTSDVYEKKGDAQAAGRDMLKRNDGQVGKSDASSRRVDLNEPND